MNSLILSSIGNFGKRVWQMYKHSAVYAVLMRIYLLFSNAWADSGIMSLLRQNSREGCEEKSIAARFFRIPMTFLAFLNRKAGAFWEAKIKDSFFCNYAKSYIQNFMAVNTRFFGVMALAVFVSYNAVGFAMGKGLSKISAAAAVIGIILALMNYNIMSFFNNSKVVEFVKSCAGFKELSLEFFDKQFLTGKGRLVTAVFVGILCGALMAVSPLIGAAVPFAVFGCLLVLYAPITGVYAAVFLAPIVPTMILAGICAFTLISLVIKSITKKDFKWRFEGVGLGLLILLAVLFVSSLMSFSMMGSIKVWAMYLIFISFYFVVINSIDTKEQLYGLFKIFIISGALVALYGIMQYLFGWNTTNAWIDEEMFEDATVRVYSTLANPNVLGEYLLLVLPIAAVYMIKFKWNTLAKWVYMLMFAVLALCLVLTQSRGCWIGFMIGVVIFITFYNGKLWGLIPIVVCILPFVLPQSVIERILSVGNLEDSSTSYRVYIWMGTLGILRHYWLGGIGMGEAAFSQVYPFFSYNAIVAPHSHNTFLQLTVEAGVGALIVFVITQIVFCKKMSVIYRIGRKNDTNSLLALGCACGVIAFLAQSMFDYTFYNYRVMGIFFMLMAMGISLRYVQKGKLK